jgi:hypothetical protein
MAARLNACVQAPGVQTEPRDAWIDVEVICHGEPTIALRTTIAIAAKARTIDGARGQESKARKQRVESDSSIACRQRRLTIKNGSAYVML